MISDVELIAAIYEAGALPERWPLLIERIARQGGARGGLLMCAKQGLSLRLCTPEVDRVAAAYEQEGWGGQDNPRVAKLMARQPYPGFLADADVTSREELDTNPVYTEFLRRHRFEAGSATMIQGAAGDGIIITFEGFPSHEHAQTVSCELDLLRPHLARAAVLSGQLSLRRASVAVEALAVMGTAAAVLDHGGRIVSANEYFAAELGRRFFDFRDRLHAADKTADQHLEMSLAELKHHGSGRSLAVKNGAGEDPIALHLVPVQGDARDIFERACCIAILSFSNDATLPSADLLQALFDLTPAEARVARSIGAAATLREVAQEQGIGLETVRTHLKRALLKTGQHRQSDLSMLVRSHAPPVAPEENPPPPIG